ncbi:spore germination protein KA [Melghirimyces profundicolus]|uniref:Spore germination protein KA n=1 Tax=Melghirimyces profundicolus TaxID=1242148 RepID=A0A2T6BTE2_9BACL|nr:spore germination protein [Melghirimyces profundicolus]PTX59342.1 spore germination protein KA [Melghirimyces profundicolus]
MRKKRSARKGSKSLPKQLQYRDQDRLFSSLEENLSKIQQEMGHSSDLVIRRIEAGTDPKHSVALVQIEGLVDDRRADEFLTKSIMVDSAPMDVETPFYDFVKENALSMSNVQLVSRWEELFHALLDGKTLVLGEGWPEALCADTAGGDKRPVTEPALQTVIRGPRDSFTETLSTNLALVRRRIKSSKLWVQSQQVGKMTRTEVAVLHLEGIADPDTVKEVIRKIRQINIDGVLESGYLEGFIQDKTRTPFPTVYNTERPDVIAGGLLEGRVAILMDNTPVALIVPTTFFQFLTSVEEYYQRWDIATATRILRFLIFTISLMGPSIYVAFKAFHPTLIPTELMVNLMAQREGVPFPAIVEAFLMEITFEILREAGIRTPRPLSTAVTIVGAIIIGETAIRAGLVTPSMVIVVSITAIASFATPSYSLANSARLIRFGLMLSAGLFGLLGLTLALIVLVAHMNSLRSFGTPYLIPVAPFVPRDQKDLFIRMPWEALSTRPRTARPLDDQRIPEGQDPEPTRDPKEDDPS